MSAPTTRHIETLLPATTGAPSGESLDPASRADENPLSWEGRWRQVGGVLPLKLESNQIQNSSAVTAFATGLWWQKWTDGDLGVVLISAPTQLTRIYARCDSSCSNGYFCDVSGGLVKIKKIASGIESVLNEVSRPMVANGQVDFKVVGHQLKFWYKPPGGSWELTAFVENSQFTEGFFGLSTNSPSLRWGVVNGGGTAFVPPVLPKATAGFKAHRYAIASPPTTADPITHPDKIITTQWWHTDQIAAARAVGATVLIYQNLTRCHEPGEDGHYSTALTVKEAEALSAKTSNLQEAGYVCLPGAPGYGAKVVEKAIEKAKLAGADGIFLDDMRHTASGTVGITDEEWRAQMEACNAIVGSGLQKAGYMAIPNMAGATAQRNLETGGWVEKQFEFYTGGFEEFSITFPNGAIQSTARIEESSAIMRRQQAKGKLYLACTNSSEEKIIRFTIGVCLLNTAGGVYFFLTPGPPPASPDYLRESWTTIHEEAKRLGLPVSGVVITPAGWERRFERGMVLVNFETNTASFTFLPAPKIRRREKPDLALDIEVETPDGSFRLPSDSKKAKNLPRNLSFGTARGEGFGIGGLNLSRDIFKSYPDIGLLDTWRAISRTGRVVYEGRLQSNPRTNDPENLLEIALIGWMSYLAGKKISPLILDSRFSSWEEPSLQRKKQLNEAGFNLSKMGVSSGWQGEAAGPNEAAIIFTPADWANTKFCAEQWFNGHGEVIAKILYNFLVLVAGGMAEFLTNAAVISTTDTAGSVTEGTNHRTTAASNQSVTRTTGDGKYAYIKSLREGGAFVGESGGDSWAFSALKVLGNHGLTLRGTWPEVGFWLTDILRYILEIYYPKVKLAGETNKFVVQQGAWHDSPATGYDIAKQLNNLALWELNMWEDRTLYHEPADLTKYDWKFKTTDPGVKVKFQGDTIENFANGCSVSYTDFDGVPHFLTPADFSELRDESEDNPANRHGEDLWTDCDVPYQCNETEALQFGAVYLAEYNRPKRPGSYEIQGGYIKDAAGNWHAGFDPRNGETVGIMDMLDDEPRLITTSQWDDESKVLTITVDAPDKLLDAIVARQQIARETRGL